MTDGDIPLARFVDRYTMRHERVYPHPRERVWRALTDPAHVRAWFTEVALDLVEGGRAAFGPAGSWWETTITALEPPRLIEFAHALPAAEAGYTRFELDEVDGGCRMTFTLHFDPRAAWPAAPHDPLGGDLPGGPDTPWRPGFVGGWHDFFDRLGRVFDGLPADCIRDTSTTQLAAHVAGQLVRDEGLDAALAERMQVVFAQADRWNELNEIYRRHIIATLPGAAGPVRSP
ncbi:MAG: SRPBCC domain-containing protein [Dehalococcoidia bacterium]